MATERETSDTSGEDRLPAPPGPSAEDLRRISEEISAHYPPPRLGTELVLLEVNPHKAHAYWNIDVEDYREAQARSGSTDTPLVLRLYDVTGVDFNGRNANTAFDVQVQGLQGHWYLDLWKDGRAFVADIGFRIGDGSLVCLARSNPVSTPAAGESAEYNTLAVDTAVDAPPSRRLTDLVRDPEPLDDEPGIDAPVVAVPAVPADAAPAPRFVSPGPLEASAPPAAAPLQPAAMPQDLQSWFTEVAESATRPAAAAPWTGPGSPPVDGKPDPLREAALAAGWPTAEQLSVPVNGHADAEQEAAESRAENEGWPTADELARHVPETPGDAPAPEAPHRSAAPAPTPPAPTSLDSYVTLSSYEQARREVALEVNVELHIYGRAKPGAELTLFGQPVPLRPDGSFSVRKPLPNGAVVLPLLAVDPPRPDGGG